MQLSKKTLSLGKTLILLAGGALGLSLIFYLLLVLSYCIPVEWLLPNISESVDTLLNEGIYLRSNIVNNGSFDNWTVALMLNEAAQSSGNPFFDALVSPFAINSDVSKIEVVELIIGGNADQLEIGYIERYWHGYLIFLKPMLIFLNLKQIRLVFQMAFAVLLCILSILLYKQLKSIGVLIALSFVVSITLFGGWEAVVTLPIFFCFTLAICGSIWASLTDLSRKSIILGFFLIGALTVYFDYLDNPLLTLSLPLTIVVIRTLCFRDSRIKAQSTRSKKVIISLLIPCAAWLFGYAALWVMKWIYVDIFVGTGVICSSIDQVLFRLGATERSARYDTSPSGAVSRILSTIGWVKYFIIIIIAFAVVVWLFYFGFSRKSGSVKEFKDTLCVGLCLAAISILPLAWILIASNHSQIHAEIIAYRTLLILPCCWTIIAFLPIVQFKCDKKNIPSSRIQ